MDHEEALQLLPGYLDNELSLSEALTFEHHMARCRTCACEHAQQREVSLRLRQADLRMAAPAELVASIRSLLPARPTLWQQFRNIVTAGRGARPTPWAPWQGSTSGRGKPALGWAPMGMSLASAVTLALSLSFFLQVPSAEQRLSQDLVDSNIRSLQVDHLLDVVSTSQHTVKPWFNGKLDFAPPVIDLAAQGYPLVGGRTDYLDGQRVAVMVYRDKLHPVSLYVWPGSEEDAAPVFRERQGYHLANWRAAGMNYWAITDAGEGELRGFVGNMRSHAGG